MMKYKGMEITIGGPEPRSDIKLPDDFIEVIEDWDPFFVRIQNVTMRSWQTESIRNWARENEKLVIIVDCMIIGDNNITENEKCQ